MKTMSASEAAQELHITRPTLYAYVSRGLIRSEAVPDSRERRYSAEDVELLRDRQELRRDPRKAIAGALHWGTPLLDSAITLIADEQIYYRGFNAVGLASERSVEEIAALLWTGDFATPLFPASLPRVRIHGSGVSAAHVALASAAEIDPAAYDTRPTSVASTGARIVTLLTAAISGSKEAAASIVGTLGAVWGVRDRRSLDTLSAALILCADHELNISSFTARCIASAGSHPYAVVNGALSALQGVRHGGVTSRVEALLDDLWRRRSAVDELRARLARGEDIPGFGHPLYRSGDPRAVAILELLSRKKTRDYIRLEEVKNGAFDLLGEHPTLDFALAALARVMKLPPASPFAIFAVGRSLGWIGHAIEQYAVAETIRPRARYVGVAPQD
jgi:citrate synthase